MAKPNYKHQKKQREQQTRLKKEEKLRKRTEKSDVKDDTAVNPQTPVTGS